MNDISRFVAVIGFACAGAVGCAGADVSETDDMGSDSVDSLAAAADVLEDDVAPNQEFRAPGSDTKPMPPMRQVNLASVKVTMAAGTARYIASNLTFGRATTHTLVDNDVTCRDSAGVALQRVVHGENIDASGGAYDVVPITTRLLFTAPRAGTYTCTLSAWMRSLGAASRVTVLSGHIEVARSVSGGAQGETARNTLVSGGAPAWTPTVPGTVTLPDVSGSLWQAPAGTAHVTAFSDISVTTCGAGDDKPCPSNTKNIGSKVRTQLVVTQFTSSGGVCKTTTTRQDSDIPRAQHHATLYHHLPNVPVLTGNGCVPKFSIYTKTEWLSGSPVYVHGPDESVTFVIPD